MGSETTKVNKSTSRNQRTTIKFRAINSTTKYLLIWGLTDNTAVAHLHCIWLS